MGAGREPRPQTKNKNTTGRFNSWLGRTRGNGGVPPFPFWEICDFPKWLQNINNVLRCKCETYLHNPCECQIKKYPCGGYFDIKCVCHTSLKLRVALLCVNCSASACQRIVADAKGGWGARIRTMIKRTKISCPTIRRHPKCMLDYICLYFFCNNNFYIFLHLKKT